MASMNSFMKFTHKQHFLIQALGSFVFFFLLPLVFVSAPVIAQIQSPMESESLSALADATPSPTPTEEEAKLQEQKRLLELQRDIELARKAIRDAQPQPEKPTTTALAGDTTLTDVKLEPEIVSYKAMSEAAKIISAELKANLDKELASDRTLQRRKKALDEKISNEKNEDTKKLLKDERTQLDVPNLAIYDAQVVKDWRFYQALFPAFEGEVKDLLNRYTTELCTEPDLSSEFKRVFCQSSNQAMLFDESTSVKAQMAAVGGVQAAFGAGTNLLKSFVDLAALFRTDTKIEGKAVTIDESALVAELFRALKNDYQTKIELYYPEVFHPRVTRADTLTDDDRYSSTVTTIGTLFLAKIETDKIIAARNKTKTQSLEAEPFKTNSERRNKLAAQLDEVEALSLDLKNLRAALDAEDDAVIKKRIRSEIADVKTKLDKLPAPTVLQAMIDSLDAGLKPTKDMVKALTEKVKRLTDLNDRFQSFVDQFVKVDSNGANALALFIKSEDIEKALPEGNSYWLEIKSVSAGGSNRTRKNLLRYFSGAKVDHSGGVIVEYTLYKRTGGVIYSDKLTHYEGYVEPKRIRGQKDSAPEFKDPVP